MAYCTQADIEAVIGRDKLIQLTDNKGIGEVDLEVLGGAIADADAWINGYVQRKYGTPLDPVPRTIKRCSARETIYILQTARIPSVAGEQDRLDHEEREKWLLNVSKGIVSPGDDPVPAKSTEIVAEVLAPEDGEVTREAFDKAFI